MEESLDLQLSRLNLNIEQLISNPLSLSGESEECEKESMQLQLSPKMVLNSSFMSDSKFLTDHHWAEEVENLAFCFDGALMAREDYRSHELRRVSVPQCVCSQLDLMKKSLDQYSLNLKQKKIQLFKDMEEAARLKKELLADQEQLEESREEFECRLGHFKKNIKDFMDHLRLFESKSEPVENNEEVEDQISIKQKIFNVERLLSTATGKLRESFQMQLNRLKTKLATLRSEAVLNNCQNSRSYSGRRSVTRNSVRAPMRFNTPIRSHRGTSRTPNSSRNDDTPGDQQMILREVNIIKTRLQEQQEQFLKRQEWTQHGDVICKIYKLEKELFKTQDDLDRQKIKLAERIGKFDSLELEFCKKQDDFYDSVEKLKGDMEGFLFSMK